MCFDWTQLMKEYVTFQVVLARLQRSVSGEFFFFILSVDVRVYYCVESYPLWILFSSNLPMSEKIPKFAFHAINTFIRFLSFLSFADDVWPFDEYAGGAWNHKWICREVEQYMFQLWTHTVYIITSTSSGLCQEEVTVKLVTAYLYFSE